MGEDQQVQHRVSTGDSTVWKPTFQKRSTSLYRRVLKPSMGASVLIHDADEDALHVGLSEGHVGDLAARGTQAGEQVPDIVVVVETEEPARRPPG
jgi:hypothetical protein